MRDWDEVMAEVVLDDGALARVEAGVDARLDEIAATLVASHGDRVRIAAIAVLERDVALRLWAGGRRRWATQREYVEASEGDRVRKSELDWERMRVWCAARSRERAAEWGAVSP